MSGARQKEMSVRHIVITLLYSITWGTATVHTSSNVCNGDGVYFIPPINQCHIMMKTVYDFRQLSHTSNTYIGIQSD